MPNICQFCDRPRVPDAEHRMVSGPSGWLEWGADCCGDTEMISRVSTAGPWITLNQLWSQLEAEKQAASEHAYPAWSALLADADAGRLRAW